MQINSRTQIVELMKHFGLPLVAAEVGVAEGRLSKELLNWGIERLYLVDLFDNVPFIKGCASFEQSWHDTNYEAALKLESEFPDKIIILKGFSYKMANEIPDNSLGMVYLDAAHDYDSVRADLDSYFPKLVSGGVMAGHDFGNPTYGVRDAVHDFCANKYNIIELPEDGDINNMGFYFIKK